MPRERAYLLSGGSSGEVLTTNAWNVTTGESAFAGPGGMAEQSGDVYGWEATVPAQAEGSAGVWAICAA